MERRDKRHAIMQTAERLFTDRRIHEITLEAVARLAGVGKGTIYLYFKDKDDLFFQVATSGFDEMCDLVQRRVRADAPFEQRLLDMGKTISAFFDSRREMLQIMMAEDARMPGCKVRLRERWLQRRKRLVAAVAEILRQGITEGVLRADLPAEVLAELLLGMFRTRARDLQDAPARFQRHEVVIDLFCRGAGRQEPPVALRKHNGRARVAGGLAREK